MALPSVDADVEDGVQLGPTRAIGARMNGKNEDDSPPPTRRGGAGGEVELKPMSRLAASKHAASLRLARAWRKARQGLQQKRRNYSEMD